MAKDAKTRPFEPVEAPPSYGLVAPAAILVLGLLASTLLLVTHVRGERQTSQEFLFDDAIADLQVTVASSHLWLEEHLAGDRTIESEDLVAELERVDDHFQILLNGLVRSGGEVVEPLYDETLRSKANRVKDLLRDLRRLSAKRLEMGGEGAGIGSSQDQSYDAVFSELDRESAELRRTLVERWEGGRREARLRLWSLVGVWTVIVVGAAGGLWSRERRRQRIDDALRRSQNWLATTLTSIGEGVITTDLEGAVTFMNPVAEEVTGWSGTAAAGRPIEEVLPLWGESAELSDAHPALGVVRHRHPLETRPLVLTDRVGRRHEIHLSASPIQTEPGTLLGVVLAFSDVTLYREAEAALKQRDAELREAQKMEAVGRLAGGIAHDVNNYLGAIRGYCEVAKMKGESGEALAKRMDDAIDTTRSVSALIRQLLAFSRRQPTEPEVVDLNDVVFGMEKLMQRLIGEDISLVARTDPALWPIEIDPTQAEQVLVNLLVNARDAMPDGGDLEIVTRNVVPDEVDLRRHAVSPGRYVLLGVSDTGCGIAPEIRDKIFEPFFTTKEELGSSGLGLATVYGIVRQAGGAVVVETEVGRGTAFKVLFPSTDNRAVQAVEKIRSEPAPGKGEPARILLVEDNEAIRDSTVDLLEAMGHTVRAAIDGEEALKLLVEEGIDVDLVITDVVMPGMSGKEMVDRLHRERPEVRCLFISGYADRALAQGLSEERVDFLSKPFGAHALGRKIEEVLST